MGKLLHLWRQTLDWVLPQRCASCGELSESWLCKACDVEMALIENRPACKRCGARAAMTDAPCGHCGDRGLPPVEELKSIGLFESPLSDLIHTAKYERRWEIAHLLAKRLVDLHGEWLADAQVIVPVPLHPLRQWLRGFNQSHELAMAMARRIGRPLCQALIRDRHTPTQTRLSKTRRQRNIRDAFLLVRPKHIIGQRVLLVDDVLTSGATIREAARTLKHAAPATICAAVLAVADKRVV